MAEDEFVDCRRKDDHTVTLPVARSALPYFPDWEPIPAAGDTEPTPKPAPEPEPEEPPTTSRPRTTARKADKERNV